MRPSDDRFATDNPGTHQKTDPSCMTSVAPCYKAT